MRKHQTFWTTEKLKELAGLYQKLTLPQLEKHFGKRREEIIQAFEFQRMHKLLKISSTKRRNVRTTIYRPAYAEGSYLGASYRHGQLQI